MLKGHKYRCVSGLGQMLIILFEASFEKLRLL